jgi:hypothetical protein
MCVSEKRNVERHSKCLSPPSFPSSIVLHAYSCHITENYKDILHEEDGISPLSKLPNQTAKSYGEDVGFLLLKYLNPTTVKL